MNLLSGFKVNVEFFHSRDFRHLLAFCVAIVLLLLPSLAAAQSPVKVRAAYGAMSAAMAPLWYAQRSRLVLRGS